ncbi:tetratricopeptide repeat protein [Leptospira ryugenii]|uniref:tetratricopeptide repeat protein n=1 Tax=Leptospira ryugenii TaxID=1917863 RepID=UPI0026D7EB74
MGKWVCILVSFLWFFSIGAEENPILKDAKKAFARKAYSEAIKKFAKYAELHPNDGEPYMYMGYIYEYKKDYPNSIQNFRKAAELNLEKSHKKTVLLKLALFFNYHQDWNAAATYSSRYLKYDPQNEEVQKIYNRAIGNRGNPNSNHTAYHVPQKQPEPKQEPKQNPKKQASPDTDSDEVRPSAEYEEELKNNPNQEELRWEYVLALFEEKKYDLAEKNILLLIEKNPNRTRYHYKLGIVKLRKDDPKAAIESFERARKNPFSKDTNVFLYYVYLNEGIAYQKLKQFDMAESSFQSAYKQVNKDTPLLALARLYHDKSEWQKCAESAESALQINPQIESHMFRFLCLAEAEKSGTKLEKSFESYFQYLETNFSNPQKAPDKYRLGFLRLARQLTVVGKEQTAEKYFSVLESDEEVNQTREYLFYRGKNLFYLNKIDPAISLLSKVNQSSAASYLLARAYAKKGDLASVKIHLKNAGSLKDEYWETARKETDFKVFEREESFKNFLVNKGKETTTPPLSNP